MGWMDEYNALKKKRKEETQKSVNSTTKNTATKAAGTSKSSGSSWMQEYNSLKDNRQAQEQKSIADKITVGSLSSKKANKEDERKWFQKGVFEDGYDPGDISKAILGTLADVGQDALTGIVGMGESAVDALMTLAPYSLQSNDPFMSPIMREQQNKIFQDAKKESAEFVAKDLYDEQAVANQLLSNMYGSFGNAQKMQNGQMLTEEDLALARENSKYAKQYIENQMEAESVLGEKSDSLMQSAGVLAAQAGLASVGVPWYLTSGVTSFGSEAENALKQGATHEQAISSAAITAGAEILTEKLFGGDIFTKNGADLASKYLSRAVSNKVLRNLLKAGYDIGGEALEEGASQFISRFGSSLYKEENLKEILFSEEALDEYLESMIGGAALGGGMTAINVAQSNAAGVDYTTGLTENEQKVVDKLYKEWQTEDMDSQEKKKLYDDILRGMDRGTIDADTISEILESDSHKAYDSLTKESDEFKELYKTPFEKLSAEQNDRLKELQAKHEAKPYEKALEEARNKRFTDTWDLVKGTRLEESFREKLRTGEDFVADFDRFKGSKHEEAARKTLQSAVDFVSKDGKKLNNTNAMHDVVDLAANIAAETGKVVSFKDGDTIKQEFIERQKSEIAKLENLKKRTAEQDNILAKMKDILSKVESGKTKVNGDITEDGITLNLDSENPLQFTVGHEVSHKLEVAKSYDKLRDALFSYAKAKNIDIDGELADRKARYAGIKNADPEKELVSDLVGRYIFDDYDFIHNLSTEHRNVAQKIYDEIKHLCKMATAGSKAARDLERAKRQFEKAFREAGEAKTAQTDTKHSISEVESYSDVGSGESVFRTGWLKSNPAMVDAIVKNRPQTKTEQFTNWFGNSQAINKSDEPLLVYHGTKARYTEFQSDGKPIWFAPNVMYARGGATQTNTADKILPSGKVFGGANERVIPAYIKAENPADFGNTSLMFEDVVTDIAQNLGIDEAELRNVWEKTGRNAELYKAVHSAEMVDLLKQYGYDSIKAIEDGSSTWAVFESNQVKSAVANKGSFSISNPDIRFSLSDAVEETKDLIAVHNLTSEQVLKSLELGGLPMPSIAVLKADSVHDEYGEVSLILPKEAIDPKTNRANKVYGGDAWTPVYPRIEYKPSAKVEKKISDKYYGLAREIGYDAVRPLYNYVTDLERQLNNSGGETAMLEKLYDDTEMMNVYLQDSGKGKIEPIEKETVTEISPEQAEMNQFFIDALGDEVIARYPTPKGENMGLHRRQFVEQYGEEIRTAYKRFFMELYDFSETEADNAVDNTSKADLLHIVRDAYQYTQNNGVTVKTEIDRQATNDAIRSAAADGYKAWVDGLFKGVEEKTGIRNNQDYYTHSGNPRSWDALHWENTLENVVKTMRGQEQTGTGSLSPYNTFASLAHKRYGSIAEIKADSDRLGKIPKEEYEAMGDAFADRFAAIARSIKDPAERNPFIATDNAAELIVDAVKTQKTKAGMLSYMQKWNERVTAQTVDDVISLVSDIANMPTGYFEAKPQRAVGFDEVGVYVIPYDADVKLKQELLNRGYAIAEYNPKVEGDRQRVVNQFEDLKFSLSDAGKPFKRSINDVYGKDVIKQNPFGEIAPIVDPNNQPSKAWTVEELFPDEQNAQAELDTLYQEQTELENQMREMSEDASEEELTQVSNRYMEVLTRVAELEGEISEAESSRADSLMGEDAPPEMDAPYYETEPTVLTKKATADIVRDVRKSLDLTNPQMQDCKDIVERWRSGEIQTREQLVDALQDKFGKYTDVEEDYLLQEIKREIRTRGINVSKDIQRNFPDYVDMMRRNRGKVRFSKQGLAVDEVYQELNSMYPGYFPMEMYSENGRQNAADQLERIIEIANLPHIKETQRNKDIGNIEEAADIIIKGIDNFRLNQDLALSERESRGAFADLLRNADRYAPEDIAPVRSDIASQPKEGKTTKTAPKKVESQKPSGRVAEVLTEASKPDKKTGFGMGFVSQTVDKGMAVENLAYETGNEELQPKYQAALSTTTEAEAQYFMENGTKGVKPFKETVTEIQKSGKQNDFERYMYHAHNVDRMSLEQRFGVPNKAVYGDTITADVSRAEVKRYEAKNPEFKQWAEEIYAITKWQRSLLVENGIISQETADLWEKMYPHYVPITRVDAKGQNVFVPLDTNKTGVNAPIKRAVGGSSNIEPMLNTIAQRIEQTYRAVARNSFGIELKNTLGTTLEGQQNAVDVDGIIETLEDQDSKLLKPGTMNANPTFTVFENGERVEFEITEELFDSLKPAGKILGHRFESSDKKVVRGIGKALNARRNLLTNWNPVFALYRNPVKDIQDVAVNSQHPIRTYANMPMAVVDLFRNGNWATEYHENGGKANTYYDSRTNEFVEEKGLKKVFGKYEAVGEFIEEVPRLAEYIASRKDGRSIERSMLDAARVTTNFAAGGDFTKFLNSHGFTFLNASVQGASQHVRNFRESYHKQGAMGAVKTLAKYVVAGVPTIVFNSLRWDDDEEYEELNDYVKQNYYVLWKTDNGKFFRVPKGRTSAVMGELMQQMENLVTGDDEADFSTFFELFMNNIAPSNPLENNILAPIAQTLTNKAWYGGDLVPSRLQKLPSEEQYDESTDILSRKIGEATGTSPYKWNYLIDQYSGGLGDVFLPMMTPEAESGDNSFMGNMLAPWKKEMTTDKVLNNKNPGDFYDLKDELEIKSNSSKATEEDALRSMYMDSVGWEMSDLYQQKREIQNSNLSDERKYNLVKNIQDQINALAKNALNHYENVSIDGLYSEAGDRRYNKDADSGKWYEIKPKNADGSDNWYYQKEQEVTKALGISYGEYWNNREEYNYAYDKPGKYAIAQAVGGYDSYMKHYDVLENWQSDKYLGADKDKYGNSISGSRKKKVMDYINGLDADYGEKIILYRTVYSSKADKKAYNQDIIDYLNSRDDISYQEMKSILEELDFEVDSQGNITW